MCTAITYKSGDFYFGRNLDLEYHYNEAVTVTPRNFAFQFRNGENSASHYAIIGMATVADGYPLYYDATNEKGLSMAGLNFPDNAVYYAESESENNVAPFELIPWVLGKCSTADEAHDEFKRINVWNVPFSEKFPLSPLHWIVSDKNRCFVVETMKDGVKMYDNPVGILTNNPPFDYHLHNLVNYINLTTYQPESRFGTDMKPYSLGMGAIGLPGDLSSASRFIRAAFVKSNSVLCESEYENVNQFFHILGSVSQQKGLNRLPDGRCEYTVYSSCCNADRGIYYYSTYEDRRIVSVDMKKENLNGKNIVSYPLKIEKTFLKQN